MGRSEPCILVSEDVKRFTLCGHFHMNKKVNYHYAVKKLKSVKILNMRFKRKQITILRLWFCRSQEKNKTE